MTCSPLANDKLINFLNTAPTPNNNSGSTGGLSKLSIYYQNVRGVNSKLIDLYNSLVSCDFQLVSLSLKYGSMTRSLALSFALIALRFLDLIGNLSN